MIAKIGAFLKFFLFLKLSYFCDKHLISFEDNTISQIFIFKTALLCPHSAMSGSTQAVQVCQKIKTCFCWRKLAGHSLNKIGFVLFMLCILYTGLCCIYGMYLKNMTEGPKTPFFFLLPDISRIPLLSDHQN